MALFIRCLLTLLILRGIKSSVGLPGSSVPHPSSLPQSKSTKDGAQHHQQSTRNNSVTRHPVFLLLSSNFHDDFISDSNNETRFFKTKNNHSKNSRNISDANSGIVGIDISKKSELESNTSDNNLDYRQDSKYSHGSNSDISSDYNSLNKLKSSEQDVLPLHSRDTSFLGVRNKRQNPFYFVQLQPRPVRVIQKKMSSPVNVFNILSFDSIKDEKQQKPFPTRDALSRVSKFASTDAVKTIPMLLSDSEVPDLVSVLSAAPPPVQINRKAINKEITNRKTLPSVTKLSTSKDVHIPTMKPSLDSNNPVTFSPSQKDPFLIPVEGNQISKSHNLSSVDNASLNSSSPSFAHSSLIRLSQQPLSDSRAPSKQIHPNQNTQASVSSAPPFNLPVNKSLLLMMLASNSSKFLDRKKGINDTYSFPTYPSPLFFQDNPFSRAVIGSQSSDSNVQTLKHDKPLRALLPLSSPLEELSPSFTGIASSAILISNPNFPSTDSHNFPLNASLKESLLSKNLVDNQVPVFPGLVLELWTPIISSQKVFIKNDSKSENNKNLILTTDNSGQDQSSWNGEKNISKDLKPMSPSPSQNISQTGAVIFKDHDFLYIPLSNPGNQSIVGTQVAPESELLTQFKSKPTSFLLSDALVHPLSHTITKSQYIHESVFNTPKVEFPRPNAFIQTQSLLHQKQVYKDQPIVQVHSQNLTHPLTVILKGHHNNDLLSKNNMNQDPHHQQVTKIRAKPKPMHLLNTHFLPEIPGNKLQTKFQLEQQVQVKLPVQQKPQGQHESFIGSESQEELLANQSLIKQGLSQSSSQSKSQNQLEFQIQLQKLHDYIQSQTLSDIQQQLKVKKPQILIKSQFQAQNEEKQQLAAQLQTNIQPENKIQPKVNLPLESPAEFKHQVKPQQEHKTQPQSQKQIEGSKSLKDIQLEPKMLIKPQLQSKQFLFSAQYQSESPLRVDTQRISEEHFPSTKQLHVQIPFQKKPKFQLQTDNMLKHLSHSQSMSNSGKQLQTTPQLHLDSQMQSKLHLLPNPDSQSEKISQMGSHSHPELQPLLEKQVLRDPRTDSGSNHEMNLPVQPSNTLEKNKDDYEFSWGVSEPDSLLDYGHKEKRVLGKTNGLYHVLLPDGRIQTVRYTADGNGYNAIISYGAE